MHVGRPPQTLADSLRFSRKPAVAKLAPLEQLRPSSGLRCDARASDSGLKSIPVCAGEQRSENQKQGRACLSAASSRPLIFASSATNPQGCAIRAAFLGYRFSAAGKMVTRPNGMGRKMHGAKSAQQQKETLFEVIRRKVQAGDSLSDLKAEYSWINPSHVEVMYREVTA